MDDKNALNIYTDGSAPKNPGIGGIGVRFVFPDFIARESLIKDFVLSGYKGSGVGQMELKACVVALEEVLKLDELMQIKRIVIHTDSMYVVDNFQRAIYIWPAQKWLSSTGAPILNVELWKTLVKLAQKVSKAGAPVTIKWIKGHSKNVHNDAVDKLAKASALNPSDKKLSIANVRRKDGSGVTQRGSVKSFGQVLRIKVVSIEYLNEQDIYRLRGEVLSRGSKFFGKIDFFYCKSPLRAGHRFMVSLKKKEGYLEINKHRELIQINSLPK